MTVDHEVRKAGVKEWKQQNPWPTRGRHHGRGPLRVERLAHTGRSTTVERIISRAYNFNSLSFSPLFQPPFYKISQFLSSKHFSSFRFYRKIIASKRKRGEEGLSSKSKGKKEKLPLEVVVLTFTISFSEMKLKKLGMTLLLREKK